MSANRRLALHLDDRLKRAGIRHYGVDDCGAGVFHVMTYDAAPWAVRQALQNIDQLDFDKRADSLIWEMYFTLEDQS